MTDKYGAFHGRTREIGQIRSALDSPDATVLRVQGVRGVGKTALAMRAVEGFEACRVVVPSLPAPHQRDVLAHAIDPGVPPTDWEAVFAGAAGRARPGRPPFVLVLDDAHRLMESRARYERPLADALRAARADRRPFHVILVGSRPGESLGDALAPFEGESIAVAPLPLRAAVHMLPGRTARDRVRAYGVLGGIPRVLMAVDREVTLETNVRRLILDEGGALADVPGIWLERDLQTPSRYNAVLARLGTGPCDWGAIHTSVPDLTSSGQLGPYLAKLEGLGLVEARRSLDAPPTARSRRYRIVDPFLAFWYRVRLALPAHPPSESEAPKDALAGLRWQIDNHVATVFPDMCRQHMDHDARSTLGANARELGSLWGQGHEIPVAGILTSGAAFYGDCAWRTPVRGEDPLGPLDAAARETRYGFGREHRLRLFFTGADAPRWLERAAVRLNQCILLGPEALTG